MKWISVKEQLPKVNERVLVYAKRQSFYDDTTYGFIADAVYQDGETINYELEECAFDKEYLQSCGAKPIMAEGFWDYLVPKGWYETVMSMGVDTDFHKLDDKYTTVTHWASLPKMPEEE